MKYSKNNWCRTGQVVLAVWLALGHQMTSAQSAETKNINDIKLNQIQIIGTHNSYHAGLAPSQAHLVEETDPALARALDYKHPPLDVQLSHGARLLELDVWLDKTGGHYAHPKGLEKIAQAGLPSDPPFDPQGLLLRPGYKVMHKADVDYRSNCQPFVDCLRTIRSWSLAHPRHIPIFIFVENKNFSGLTTSDFDDLDHEILSVFSPSEILQPDQVRGTHNTLEEAVTSEGWPSLSQTRGKVVFLLSKQEIRNAYLNGHPSLHRRVMFTNSKPGYPDAAFTVLPESSDPKIPLLVNRGYLVFTRADIDTEEARVNSTKRRDAAFRSGAQLISTDYPAGETAPWNDYTVRFTSGEAARCNPVGIHVPSDASHLE